MPISNLRINCARNLTPHAVQCKPARGPQKPNYPTGDTMIAQGAVAHVQGASLKAAAHDCWRVSEPWVRSRRFRIDCSGLCCSSPTWSDPS